jgi:hypothetical protein
MRIKKYFLSLYLVAIAASLLQSCNLSVAVADEDLSLTPPTVASNTAMPVASPTSAPTFTSTPTITPFPTFISAIVLTTTPTQQWQSCPGIVVTRTDTAKGDMLHILRCEDGLEYDLGPLANGVYAVGPNDKFLVYVTIDGIVYISRIGEIYLNPLYDLAYEKIFTVFNKGVTPDFQVSFSGGTPAYRLILLEKNYDQKRMYDLPPRITN